MNKFNWAILGDPHWGVRGDSKIFHELFVSFYTKLLADMEANGTKTLIILGDVFERRKFVNFETLHVCKREFFDKALAAGIKIYSIAGNHDVYFKNTNRINSLDLVLSTAEYPNITHITQTAEEHVIDGQKVLFVPWVNRENYDDIRGKIDTSLARYMVAHLDMFGFEMHKGAISEHGHFDADFLSKFEKVITGHYHTKSSKGNIHYLGTPYETSWNDYGETKGYHYLTDGEFTFVPNDFKIFYRYVYDDREGCPADLLREIKDTDLSNKFIKFIVRAKRNLKLFESFVQLLETKNPADLNILDETNFVVENDEGIEELSDTLSVIRYYIESELETDLDKSKLLTNMAVLYQTAQELTDGD